MPLNFTNIDSFIEKHREVMNEKVLLRRERARVLTQLGKVIRAVLKDYETFEAELSSLVTDIREKSKTLEQLRDYHKLAIAGIESFFHEEDTISDVHDIFRIVRDALTTRIMQFVEEEMIAEGYGQPPVDYVWAGMGSEGRDEQTIITDQDNLLLYNDTNDDFASKELKDKCYAHLKGKDSALSRDTLTSKEYLDYYFEVFARKASDNLYTVGFERCKGGVMAINQKWRGSLKDWQARIEEGIIFEKGIFEPLDVIILTDARAIYGNYKLLDVFLDYFFSMITENKRFMKDFIKSAVLMPNALGFFGNFKVEKEGEFKGKFNLKLLGWAPLILSVRMTCLASGIYEKNTLKRIGILRGKKIINKDMEKKLIDAYLIFVRFRLMNQINAGKDIESISNYLKPDMLGQDEQEKLRRAMKTVESFQKYIQETLLFGEAI